VEEGAAGSHAPITPCTSSPIRFPFAVRRVARRGKDAAFVRHFSGNTEEVRARCSRGAKGRGVPIVNV